jgi:hypothetical protein
MRDPRRLGTSSTSRTPAVEWANSKYIGPYDPDVIRKLKDDIDCARTPPDDYRSLIPARVHRKSRRRRQFSGRQQVADETGDAKKGASVSSWAARLPECSIEGLAAVLLCGLVVDL